MVEKAWNETLIIINGYFTIPAITQQLFRVVKCSKAFQNFDTLLEGRRQCFFSNTHGSVSTRCQLWALFSDNALTDTVLKELYRNHRLLQHQTPGNLHTNMAFLQVDKSYVHADVR
jgi:hypothetical protein